MSINKMLIDATHPEETRVVVLRNNRVEEFDYESAARKLLRGSIYLAKITRVEPSLQASFVDYGGNRHGFLAFAEIHPDYYQIPHADKIALLEQESREQAAYDDDLDDEHEGQPSEAQGSLARPNEQDETSGASEQDRNDAGLYGTPPNDPDFEAAAIDVTGLLPPEHSDSDTANLPDDANSGDTRHPPEAALETAAAAGDSLQSPIHDHVHITAHTDTDFASSSDPTLDDDEDIGDDDAVESLNDGNDDDDDVVQVHADDDEEDDSSDHSRTTSTAPTRRARTPRPRRRARQYKIQEVIKRRQIVLIQVVKEERGNKGAALTTYLSLAGRYTVLMPNTARGGGISRKITNVQDRKRLKAIAEELEVPEGMGLIIRTAGAARTKQEIKRDFEYLLRLWENVRNLTLESTAPSLVYEEGNLIKRSIRDLYTKEIDEVVVAGDNAFTEARGFMRMLMPSHAKNVIKHEDPQSLFAKYRIEHQLNQMFSPNVQLKSGGYLVINQTEALVAIDVNSGKSTREFSIEETALNTNLEAAEEVARQLKLRDLAGLIVVDFIDMEENRNNRAVERRLKEALRIDRARIQLGRISHFGLLEMSRQRLRTGVLEGSTMPCEHCQGSGVVRSIESVSLAVLRGLEDALVAGKMASCAASCSGEVALYLLNQKRAFIQELEERYGVVIHVRSSSKQQGANFLIEPLNDFVPDRPRRVVRDAVNIDAGFAGDRVPANDDEGAPEIAEDEADQSSTGDDKPRRRRRRGGARSSAEHDQSNGHGRSNDRSGEIELADRDDDSEEAGSTSNGDSRADGDNSEDRPRRSRRRGRRGGRRHRDQRPANGEISADRPDQHDHAHGTRGQDSYEPIDQPQAGHGTDQDTAPGADHSVAHRHEEPEALSDRITGDKPAGGSVAAREEILEPTGDASRQQPAIDTAASETHVTSRTAGDGKSDDNPPDATRNGTSERAARSQPVASQPVRQRVVVGPNSSSSEAATSPEALAAEQQDPAKPSRRGWWQRQFGG